jgi:hypothetical protein
MRDAPQASALRLQSIIAPCLAPSFAQKELQGRFYASDTASISERGYLGYSCAAPLC